MTRLLSCFLAICLLPIASLALAGPGVWTSSGPEGGTVMHLAVDPAEPATIYLGGSNGVYKSTNTGVTWNKLDIVPYFSWLRRLVLNPHDNQMLIVSNTSQLFRSSDGGANWQALAGGLPVPGTFFDVQFDSIHPGRVWTVGATGLWRSDDNGQTWSQVPATGLSADARVLRPDPHVAGRMLALDQDGLYRSVDHGHTWTMTPPPPPAAYGPFKVISHTSAADVVLAATTHGEMLRSVDGGASFSRVSLGAFANVILPDAASVDTWWLGMNNGLVRTTDGGATYAVVGEGIRPAAGGSFDNGVGALYVDPANPDILYAGADFTGFYVSENGGASWTRRNNGLAQVEIRALAVQPQFPSWVYAGYGDADSSPSDGLFHSVDRGQSWFSSSPSLEAVGLRTLLVDPNTAANPFTTTIYAAGYGYPLLSLSGAIRDGNGGIYKSTDGGATWTTIDNGIPRHDQYGYEQSWFVISRTVIADPNSGSGPGGDGPLQTLYLGGSGTIHRDGDGMPVVRAARIYKSTDAGASWTASDSGLPLNAGYPVQVVPLAINPDNPLVLYAGTTSHGYDPGHSNPLESDGVINGVFKSTDAGATWTHSSNGLPRMNPADPDSAIRTVLALVLAPSQPQRLYAATNNMTGDSIVYRSNDGGASWQLANTGIAADADIRALVVDPDNADIVYAGSTGSEINPGGVYRSVDGGLNWSSYSIGLPSSAASALYLDKSGAIARLYAGTRNGVYSIDQVPDEDSDGVANAIEAAAPNGGDGNGDGIPDTLQAHVASLLDGGDGTRGGDSYLTLEVEPLLGSCDRLENTHTLPASDFPLDRHHHYPFGLVRLDLPACGQARLHLHVHGADFDAGWRFRVYAPLHPEQPYTYAWRDLPFERNGQVWTVTVTDNELGDLRASEDAILFQGGVAQTPILFRDGFEGQ
ncbi:MAG: hypothetical protein M0Q42_08930 [Xanthomonadales bacterium]|nr:hypothetical protein [Xanthomonadales bacterium]